MQTYIKKPDSENDLIRDFPMPFLPAPKVTFVNMTARCGSTLLGQMISRTPKAFVMSEPWAWMHLHGHYVGGDISMAEYRDWTYF